jgi:small-conductance mechanosensitive channel
MMVVGLALRDMLLAAFTGVLLNVEKPLKPGDMVRINDKWQGKVEKPRRIDPKPLNPVAVNTLTAMEFMA